MTPTSMLSLFGMLAAAAAMMASSSTSMVAAGIPLQPVCTTDQYCCPDALKCLTPTNVTCANNPNACSGSFVRGVVLVVCVGVAVAVIG